MPCWLQLSAYYGDRELDHTRIYVVPLIHWTTSIILLGVAVLAGAYSIWLALSLSGASEQSATWELGALVVTIGGPIITVVAPIMSGTLRRWSLNIVVTLPVCVAMVVAGILLAHELRPVSVENTTPEALEVTQKGKASSIPPGGTALYAARDLRKAMRDAALEKKEKAAKAEKGAQQVETMKWLKAVNLCIVQGRSSTHPKGQNDSKGDSGPEAKAEDCVAFRPVDWSPALLKLLPEMSEVRVGCNAAGIDENYLAHWKSGASGRVDRDYEVKLSLQDYLSESASAGAKEGQSLGAKGGQGQDATLNARSIGGEVCASSTPNERPGVVSLRPFRERGTHQHSPLPKLGAVPVKWKANEVDRGLVWTVRSKGPVGEIVQQLSSANASLYRPEPVALALSVHRDERELATLWCAAGMNPSVSKARVGDRLRSLKLNKRSTGSRARDRPRAHHHA